MVTKNLVVTGA